LHISAIKAAILVEAEHFVYLRWNERIDYLNWLDPDSYDFEEQEIEEDELRQVEIDESIVIDLNAAFMDEEDPTDITHFAFFDRRPMSLEEIGSYQIVWDEPQETPIVSYTQIEPMMLCLETAEELSAVFECTVCLEEKSAIHFDTTNCGHSFCHSCICHHLDTSKNGSTCPNCRTMIRTLEVKDAENYDDIVKRYVTKEQQVSQFIPEEENEFDWLTPSGITIFM
jgi:ssRNA-specific RNase YbeY (16S rRNA maturation enzyme)